MFSRFLLLLFVGLLFCCPLVAQEKSNKGKEFWLGYGYNYGFNNEPPVNQQELVLYLSAEEPANVTVSVNGTSWSKTVSIPANTVNATVTIPKSGADDARIFNEGLFSKGIRIVSDTPIVVYAHLYNTMVSGATMLMPVETYGYKYYSLNYSQSTSGDSPPTATSDRTQNGPDWYSWFYVIAPEDNTTIQITPSDTTRGGWLPGQTYTVNLKKGEIYNVMGKLASSGFGPLYTASKDMTGSKIVSVPGADGNCHPVAVFSGSSGIRLCKGDGGEYMQQQVFPTQAWGTRYLTYHTLNNTTTDINDQFKNFYRIAVSDPTTVVKRNGTPLTNLVNNFYYEYIDSLGGDYIESDKPILLAQYTPGGNRCYMASQFAYGDPEMFYLSALEQGKKDVLFYTTRNSKIDYVYLNVIVPTAGLPSLKLDGAAFLAANIKPHPNHPGYSVAVARIPGAAAQHRLTCDSAFMATVYGLGYFESYGYSVGTFINNLNYYSKIKNVYSTLPVDTFTCPKTPVRLFVKLGYEATSINWQLSKVPGLFPNTDSLVNNPVPIATETINGRTYYTYTLQQDFTFANPGTYYIPVIYSAMVIENCSKSEKAEVKVVVKPGPKADFNVAGSTCLNDSIQFKGAPVAGSFNLISYDWLFDDNSTANTINTVKKFATPGAHNVRFKVFADNGCAGDTTKVVNLSENPKAKFGVAAASCSGEAVQFTDSSSIASGTISSWQWNFGDGTSVTHTNNNPFAHSFVNPGTFAVSLTTTSAAGCKSDTAKRTVTVMPKPLAKFGYDKNICIGDSIRFSDSSILSTGSIINWNWNFGDGKTATYNDNKPFYHAYATAGSYTVSLSVQAANGCKSDTFKLNVFVNNKPTATFSMNGKPCVDSLYRFTSSLPFNSANPANYYWSFGDGEVFNSAAANNASHAYSATLSNITIKHVVSYGPGCSSDTASQTIALINQNPVAQFALNPDEVCAGSGVQFTSTIGAGNASWNWNFGNGTGNGAPPFSRTYAAAGNYTVSLVLRTPPGCGSAPVTKSLTVHPVPPVSAGPDKFVTKGGSVTLGASLSNATSYNILWSPSMFLSDATVLNPVSTPDTSVLYVITATNKTTNCSSKDSAWISIIYELYVPNAFTPNNDGRNDRWQIPGMAIYPDARVTVFNRWGQAVYSTKNYYENPWDGSYRGKPQPTGSFVYWIELAGYKRKNIKGTVTLIR
jgi:gliding motility-associated-like protein